MPNSSTDVRSRIVVGLLAGARIAIVLGLVLGTVSLAIDPRTLRASWVSGLSFREALVGVVAGCIAGGPIWTVLGARAKTVRAQFWAFTLSSLPLFLIFVFEIANGLDVRPWDALPNGAALALYLAMVFGSLWSVVSWAWRRVLRR